LQGLKILILATGSVSLQLPDYVLLVLMLLAAAAAAIFWLSHAQGFSGAIYTDLLVNPPALFKLIS
jgi:hypothetical protein